MKFEDVAYVKSALSTISGRLELLENGDIAFTKYKNQVMNGRFGLLGWLMVNLVLLFLKDKLLFTIPRTEIIDCLFTQGTSGGFAGIGGKFGELEIRTAAESYKFLLEQAADPAPFVEFANRVKA